MLEKNPIVQTKPLTFTISIIKKKKKKSVKFPEKNINFRLKKPAQKHGFENCVFIVIGSTFLCASQNEFRAIPFTIA